MSVIDLYIKVYGQEKLPNLVTEDFESVKEYNRRDRGRGRFYELLRMEIRGG